MRKIKKLIFFVVLHTLATESFPIDEFIPFPTTTSGINALKKWVAQNRTNFQVGQKEIRYDESTIIYALFHNSGSGRANLDAYIYGCVDNYCQMIAMRRTSSNSLDIELNQNKSELLLKSSKGEVYLAIPFFGKEK